MDTSSALANRLVDAYRARSARSAELYARASRVMPGGDTRTGTFHAPYPLFIKKGAGARVWDADGNEYLDFLNNFTSLIHGHAHPAVQDAIVRQSAESTVHGSANELQVQLAEVLIERVPSVERLRFCNSGTEATLFALRAAKAFSGRSKIMKMEGGYHGSHDQVAVAMLPPYEVRAVAGLSPGALSEVVLGRMNDLAHTESVIERHRDDLAAVIVEPVMGAAGGIRAEPEFLAGLRAITSRLGIVLIFDEIITFRLGYGGAQEGYGIRPDLTTFGKIVGGGLPIGAFGGRAEIMATYDPTRRGAIIHSGTYNGNAVTMAAGIATLERFDRAAVERLNRMGDELRERLNGVLRQVELDAQVCGQGSVMQLHGTRREIRTAADAARADAKTVSLMHLAMLDQGIFSASRQMYVLSTVMTPTDLDRFVEAFETSAAMLVAANSEPATSR
ncbi:MAG: aspartate aminotransferase family protein [Gemmatimonadales bacterium]